MLVDCDQILQKSGNGHIGLCHGYLQAEADADRGIL